MFNQQQDKHIKLTHRSLNDMGLIVTRRAIIKTITVLKNRKKQHAVYVLNAMWSEI